MIVFPNGGGLCLVDLPEHPPAVVANYLAGPAAQVLLGLLLLVAFRRLRRPGATKLAAGLLAVGAIGDTMHQMIETPFAVLVHADFPMALLNLDRWSFAPALAAVGLVGLVATILGPGRLVLREAEAMLGPRARVRGLARAGLVAAVLLLPGPGGVGVLPLLQAPVGRALASCTLAFHALLALLLYATPRPVDPEPSRVPSPGLTALGLAAGAAAGAYLAATLSVRASGIADLYR